MKNKLLIIFAALLLIVSIVAVAYPSVSSSVNQTACDNAIERFDDRRNSAVYQTTPSESETGENEEITASAANEETSSFPVELYTVSRADLNRLLEDSERYNNSLKSHQDMDIDFSESALDLTDYGIWDNMYGYVTADSIGMSLPIYLGSSDYNMAYGAVHLNGTSLPIGGKGTNCVLAGHTGYIGRSFFDNISSLELGDTVTITNYFYSIDYKVTNTMVISNTDTDCLYIRPDDDRLVLMTCAYGGTKRLVVICTRK